MVPGFWAPGSLPLAVHGVAHGIPKLRHILQISYEPQNAKDLHEAATLRLFSVLSASLRP